MVKPQVIRIVDPFDFRGQIRVESQVDQLDTRVHEIGLPLKFAASKVWYEALALDEIHTKEFDLLSIPVAEFAAGEVGVVKNGVEPVGLRVVGVRITRRIKIRAAESSPISIVGKFKSGHESIDVLGLTCQWIELVVTCHIVGRMADVISIDMPTSRSTPGSTNRLGEVRKHPRDPDAPGIRLCQISYWLGRGCSES